MTPPPSRAVSPSLCFFGWRSDVLPWRCVQRSCSCRLFLHLLFASVGCPCYQRYLYSPKHCSKSLL